MEDNWEFHLIDFSVMAEYLSNFKNVDDFNGSLYLFEPEYTDEELLQFDEPMTRHSEI